MTQTQTLPTRTPLRAIAQRKRDAAGRHVAIAEQYLLEADELDAEAERIEALR